MHILKNFDKPDTDIAAFRNNYRYICATFLDKLLTQMCFEHGTPYYSREPFEPLPFGTQKIPLTKTAFRTKALETVDELAVKSFTLILSEYKRLSEAAIAMHLREDERDKGSADMRTPSTYDESSSETEKIHYTFMEHAPRDVPEILGLD